jgi:hypothetical protein
VLTSELARGSYRNESSADATNDLAAFKESGGIEYGGHVLLVLRSVSGNGEFVVATMPKNRLGVKLDFTLKLDRESTVLTESNEDPRLLKDNAAAEAAIPEIAKALEGRAWPGMSGRAIEELVPRDGKTIRSALRIMAVRGLVTASAGPRGAVLWAPVAGGAPQYAPGTFAPPEAADAPALDESLGAMGEALNAQRGGK